MDGTSIKIFIDDFFLALEGKELVQEKHDANEYSLKEQEELKSPFFKESKEYYEKLVGDVEVDSSLVENKKDETISYQSFKQKLSIKNKDVKKATTKVGVKTSTYFLAAFSYLLAKFNMDNEALFLTVNNARTKEVERSFGSFVKTYPLYMNFENINDVENLLKSVNEENINKLMDICIENDVKGILFFGVGLTLREGNREYFYECLDKSFPGLKEKYIKQYSNKYEVSSNKNEVLSKIIIDRCKKHNIICDINDVFAYLRKYPDKFEQISLF